MSGHGRERGGFTGLEQNVGMAKALGSRGGGTKPKRTAPSALKSTRFSSSFLSLSLFSFFFSFFFAKSFFDRPWLPWGYHGFLVLVGGSDDELELERVGFAPGRDLVAVQGVHLLYREGAMKCFVF